jgi:hypothetical protein
VYLYWVLAIVQPIVYSVRESYAQVVGRTLLVEHHVLPATGTPQIATVIDGEPQVLYAIRLAMQYSI